MRLATSRASLWLKYRQSRNGAKCELRQIVFGWTKVQFPFRVRSGRKLKLIQLEIITVIGKAFFDNGARSCRSLKPENRSALGGSICAENEDAL